MRITRHYLTINGRTVHYRKCGKGPALLMIHQSPRSSAEYEALMKDWGTYFTCIAPDTAGFGQSDPLKKADANIDDFADSLAEFVQALGLEKTLAYGFHSGGIILVTALKRHPQLFSALAVGGYAVWTAQEMAAFDTAYLTPFKPMAYGEHLTWLWNRIVEQSWFFPWFDARPEARLSIAHADINKVHSVVIDMLASGDAYRVGYGAVMRAPRDIPAPDSVTPPVLITAYDGDPLQGHIDRLGDMPSNWEAHKVATPPEHHAESLEFLKRHAGPDVDDLTEDSDKGFTLVSAGDFDGLIHWQAGHDNRQMAVPKPGRSIALLPNTDYRIDPPGHGLSDAWEGAPPTDWSGWEAVFKSCSTLPLALPEADAGDPQHLYPDLIADRHGSYLTQAWTIVRARHFFSPWYMANAQNAQAFDPVDLDPEKLAIEHRALLYARQARAYANAILNKRG
jgi:haloalkane dehalogenase